MPVQVQSQKLVQLLEFEPLSPNLARVFQISTEFISVHEAKILESELTNP